MLKFVKIKWYLNNESILVFYYTYMYGIYSVRLRTNIKIKTLIRDKKSWALLFVYHISQLEKNIFPGYGCERQIPLIKLVHLQCDMQQTDWSVDGGYILKLLPHTLLPAINLTVIAEGEMCPRIINMKRVSSCIFLLAHCMDIKYAWLYEQKQKRKMVIT